MHYNPKEGFPRATAELVYKDPKAALEWLTRAFGFRELLRWTAPNGVVSHVDMELEGGLVMLTVGDRDYQNPNQLHQHCCRLVFFVAEVDEHHRKAKRAGAKILSEPQDKPWGLRQYIALDVEGHLWEFSQHVRDVEPEDWGATVPTR